MKNNKYLLRLSTCLLVILYQYGLFTGMVLVADSKAHAQENQQTVVKAKFKGAPISVKRFCDLKNLYIIADPDPKNPTSKQPVVKQSIRVPCPNNKSKLCSKWSYRYFWDGTNGALGSIHLSMPSHLNLLDIIPGHGATKCLVNSAGNQNPSTSNSNKILGPGNLGQFNFEARWISCGVEPDAKRIEVSFITPLAKPGIASAGAFGSSFSEFCAIAGAGIRNEKPLGSSPNVQCLPPKKGDIVGMEIRRDPDGNLDIGTGLRFFIKKGTKVSFQGCDQKIKGNIAIQPHVVKSKFTTCGSSKGGSLCLIKNPRKPKGKDKAPQTFSITEGQFGEAGMICVDLKNARPKGCDITGTNPEKYCNFFCDSGGPLPKCDGSTYACDPYLENSGGAIRNGQ